MHCKAWSPMSHERKGENLFTHLALVSALQFHHRLLDGWLYHASSVEVRVVVLHRLGVHAGT